MAWDLQKSILFGNKMNSMRLRKMGLYLLLINALLCSILNAEDCSQKSDAEVLLEESNHWLVAESFRRSVLLTLVEMAGQGPLRQEKAITNLRERIYDIDWKLTDTDLDFLSGILSAAEIDEEIKSEFLDAIEFRKFGELDEVLLAPGDETILLIPPGFLSTSNLFGNFTKGHLEELGYPSCSKWNDGHCAGIETMRSLLLAAEEFDGETERLSRGELVNLLTQTSSGKRSLEIPGYTSLLDFLNNQSTLEDGQRNGDKKMLPPLYVAIIEWQDRQFSDHKRSADYNILAFKVEKKFSEQEYESLIQEITEAVDRGQPVIVAVDKKEGRIFTRYSGHAISVVGYWRSNVGTRINFIVMDSNTYITVYGKTVIGEHQSSSPLMFSIDHYPEGRLGWHHPYLSQLGFDDQIHFFIPKTKGPRTPIVLKRPKLRQILEGKPKELVSETKLVVIGVAEGEVASHDLHRTPGLNSEVEGFVLPGEVVEVLDEAGSWLQIKDRYRNSGWLSSGVVLPAKVLGSLPRWNVRSGPGATFPIVGQLGDRHREWGLEGFNAEFIGVINQTDNGWWHIIGADQMGWIQPPKHHFNWDELREDVVSD